MFRTIQHNWKDGVKETLSFRTEITESSDGSEQRIALLREPRRKLSYTTEMNAQESWARHKSFTTSFGSLQKFQDVTQIAGWVEYGKAGEAFIYTDRKLSLEAGEYVIVDYYGAIAVEITGTFSPTAFSKAFNMGFGFGYNISNLEDDLRRNIEVPAVIYPVVQGYLDFNLEMQFLTDDVSVMKIDFMQKPGTVGYWDVAPESTLLLKPNWSNGINHSVITPFDEVDYEFGILRRYQKITAPVSIRNYSFALDNSQDIHRLRDLFLGCKGRQKTFIMPSWTRDIRLTNSLVSGNSQIKGYVSGAIYPKAVMIYMKNGESIYRDVVQPATIPPVSDDAPMTLTLTSPLNLSAPLDDVDFVSVANKVRFSSDELLINWITSNVATVQINVQTVRE